MLHNMSLEKKKLQKLVHVKKSPYLCREKYPMWDVIIIYVGRIYNLIIVSNLKFFL
jgi:hypothetical protein